MVRHASTKLRTLRAPFIRLHAAHAVMQFWREKGPMKLLRARRFSSSEKPVQSRRREMPFPSSPPALPQPKQVPRINAKASESVKAKGTPLSAAKRLYPFSRVICGGTVTFFRCVFFFAASGMRHRAHIGSSAPFFVVVGRKLSVCCRALPGSRRHLKHSTSTDADVSFACLYFFFFSGCCRCAVPDDDSSSEGLFLLLSAAISSCFSSVARSSAGSSATTDGSTAAASSNIISW
mmetsp:Transcript_12470/g.37616  ORF Transcript_12470/g.37616 Transcript_12470/m.37616 type:complete len:235 (+) Transcript_12470:667-1371(+)